MKYTHIHNLPFGNTSVFNEKAFALEDTAGKRELHGCILVGLFKSCWFEGTVETGECPAFGPVVGFTSPLIISGFPFVTTGLDVVGVDWIGGQHGHGSPKQGKIQ